MPQHDFIIDNAGGASVRGDLNNALQALASGNLGTAAPSTPYQGMEWWDTSTTPWVYKRYDGADWISVFSLDTAANTIAFEGIYAGGYVTNGCVTDSFSLGNLNAATTLSISNGNMQHGTVTGDFTLTAPNDARQGYLELELSMDGTGGHTVTLAGVTVLTGTLDNTASAVNLLRFTKANGGTDLEITQRAGA